MCIYMRERPGAVSVCMSNSSNMSFLDIKNPAKRTALVDGYVKPKKTVRQRNMVNREMKLAIGEELQTRFHGIVSATKQAADKTAEDGGRRLILYKEPRPQHYTIDDYAVYKAIVAHTRVSAYPNKRTGSALDAYAQWYGYTWRQRMRRNCRRCLSSRLWDTT